jgi:hypothetical protein
VGVGLQPLLALLNAAIPGFARTRPRAPRLPRPPPPQPETDPAALEALLGGLDAAKGRWVRVPTRERAALLRATMDNFIAMLREFAAASAAAKGSYEGGLGDEM